MLRHIDDSVKPWQRPGPRRRLGFALLGVLIALSYALLLAGEEAQAKGGKQSPNGESAERAIGGAAKPVQEAAGEVNKLAGNEGAGGKDVGSLAARDPAPRADKPAPVDDGTVRNAARETTTPVVEPALDEATSVTSPALEGETKLPRAEPILDEATTRLPKAEPILEETTKPEIAPVLNRATLETGPVLERTTALAQPVLEETTSTVEPVLERATAPVSPVLEKTASTVEPVLGVANTLATPILEEANLPVEPALAQTLPAVEPALDGAISAAAEPIGEAVEPVAQPLGEEAIPTVGPVLEEASFPGVEPAVGAAAPVSETVAPVVGSGFGEGVVRQSAEPPVLEGNAGAIPASLSALPSRALVVETRGALPDTRPAPATLGSVRDYGPVRGEPPASTVEPPGARSGLFDGSFAIDGSHAALLGAITAKDAREGMPRPFPFGFPPAAPPVGSSFGGSGAGVALELLAILALLLVLSRVGELSRSNRAAFRLGSSLRLAVERPG